MKINYVIWKGIQIYPNSTKISIFDSPSSFPPSIVNLPLSTQTSLTGASWQTCDFWGRWIPRPGAGRGGAWLWRPERSRGVSGRRPGLDAEQQSPAPRSLVSTGAPCWCPGTGGWDQGWGNAQGKPEKGKICGNQFIRSCTNTLSVKVKCG